MGFIAKEPLRFGDGVIMPGDEVPVEDGRNYRGMLQRGEIVLVGEENVDVSGPGGKISRGRGRRKKLDEAKVEEPQSELVEKAPAEEPTEPVGEPASEPEPNNE